MRTRLHLLAVAAFLFLGCGSSTSVTDVHTAMSEGTRAAGKGFWQEALFRFEQAARLAPEDPRVLSNVAVAQEALGRYEAALATYKRAIELAPSDSSIKRNYARFAEFYSSYARGAKIKKDDNAKP